MADSRSIDAVVLVPWLIQVKPDWHQASPAPVCTAIAAFVPALGLVRRSYFSADRPDRSTGSSKVTPNQPPSAAAIRSPWVPAVWKSAVCSTVPALVCHGADAQPSTPSSKEASTAVPVGSGLTVTVTVATFDNRPAWSRTTYDATALPANPATGTNVTTPVSR